MELRKKYLDFDIDGSKYSLKKINILESSFNKKNLDENRLNLRKQIFFKKILEIKEKQIKERTQNDINKKFKELEIPDDIKYLEIPNNVYK